MPKRDNQEDLENLSSPNPPSQLLFPKTVDKTAQPTEQKRRRVTRACDNCRQKKVKCDGKQPCIHCTVYSYNCTYDQPNIRNKKNSGIPTASISPILQGRPIKEPIPAIAANVTLSQNIINLLLPKLKINVLDERSSFDFDKLQKIYNFVQSKGSINLNEIQELYRDGPTTISPGFRGDRQSSVSSNDDNSMGKEIRLVLPSKETALNLIYTTWNKACVLFRFYHRPSLLEEVDLLYSLDPFNYTDRQQKFLPFLYSILACGSLFSKSSEADSNNEILEDEGFNYFLEARKLIDITNVGDISSIQTIVMMIMYLQCSARLSTCYSYIGIALRSAIKEGLHRDLSIFQSSKRKLDPIEIDTRKRLFYTIYKMDIYINSLLGLPRSINEDEIDQELPVELDDENVTRESYLYEKQQGRLSSSGCANHHTKLMLILSHIVRKLYPIKVKHDKTPSTPDHIHTRVNELELELKSWLDNLPEELKPTDPNDRISGRDIPEKFSLANYYIHLSFLNCQIMLYRPFIHFVSNGSHFQASDPRSLIRGRNCIKVARMVVKLANKMIDQNQLIGTYWFSMYTIFFSIACLIYYFHYANYHNSHSSGVNYAGVLFDDDLNIDMIRKDIEIGKKVLDCLKNNSNSSLRIYNILNNLFEQLNRRTANTSRVRTQMTNTDFINNFQKESVQSTFSNFDSINTFQKDPTYNSFAPREPLLNENFATYENLIPKDAAVTSNPAINTENSTSQPYVPGVIDKLDAQIFGKILPPYMLERNANNADSTDSTTSPDVQPQQSQPLPDVSQMNVGGFDFSSLGDPNNLDYLDPFNPINNESPYNFGKRASS